MKSRTFLIFFIWILATLSGWSQCYHVFLEAGKKYAKQGDWEKSIEAFNDAKVCKSDKPLNGDAIIDKEIAEVKQKQQVALNVKKSKKEAREVEERINAESAIREDNAAWDVAEISESATACQYYLDNYPLGAHRKEAATCIQNYSDYDKDGVLNIFDSCPWEKGSYYNNGCKEPGVPCEQQLSDLSKKLSLASIIHVKDIEITPLRSGLDENSEEYSYQTSKSKHTEKLLVCFLTEENEVSLPGEETFYIRIEDPTGAPLAIESLGSGIAYDMRSDSEFRYTTTASTQYANSEQKICGSWQPGVTFISGEYKVEIYNKGYLSGKSTFILK